MSLPDGQALDRGPRLPHISPALHEGRPAAFKTRTPGPSAPAETRTMGILPGGYNFIHLVFWTVVGMVAVGTNITVVILLTGLGILALESFGKG